MADKVGTQRPPDGGWGWVVCFASFWINGAIFSVLNCSGVLYVKLKEKYTATHDEVSFVTSWVGSVAIGVTFLLSPISSLSTDRFGVCKTAFCGGFLACLGMLSSSFVTRLEMLYLTYGVLLGMGASLAYTPSMVILGSYFRQRLGLVNGLVTAGSSIFTMIMPPLLRFMLDTFDLPNTFRILSLLMGTIMLCALAFRPVAQPDQPKPLQAPNYSNRLLNVSIWKNKKYIIWTLSIPLALFGYFVPYVHLVQHTKDILPNANGELLVTCIGLTSGIGRIVFGKLADLPRINPICLQQLAFVFIGTLTVCLVFAKNIATLVVICLFLGLGDGCFISLLVPIAFEIVGQNGASQAIGFLLGFCSIPLTVGPPIAGFLYDHLGNYNVAFVLAGIPPIAGASLMYLIHKLPSLTPECKGLIVSNSGIATIKKAPETV